MTRDDATLIINPTRFPRMVPRLTRLVGKQIGIPVRVTTSREDFVAAIREFAESSRRFLLVWGGDGTVHDAVNALLERRAAGVDLSNKAVGFLRGGSGNGTQDSYDVPRRLEKQVEAYGTAMDEDMTVDVDLLRVRAGDGVRYGQLMGLGFDTRVLDRRSRGRTRFAPPGVIRYIYSATRVFFSPEWAQRRVSLRLEKGKYAFRGIRINAEFAFESITRELSFSLLEIGTRPYYGALFKVCPDVVCNDGLMDVYAYCFTRRMQVARNVGALWSGRHGIINDRLMDKGHRGVIERYEVTGVELHAPGERYYHVDGELLQFAEAPEERRLRVDLVPRGLRFLVPPTYYRLVHPFV